MLLRESLRFSRFGTRNRPDVLIRADPNDPDIYERSGTADCSGQKANPPIDKYRSRGRQMPENSYLRDGICIRDMEKHMTIRPLRDSETALLEEFLYEAIYRPNPSHPLSREVLRQPSLRIYIEGFGTRPDDRCLVAEVDGRVVGAAWCRCMRAFGHVDDAIPELAVSLLPAWRGCGIGTRLIQTLLHRLSEEGYPAISLSVQRENPAVRLYKRLGFRICRQTDEEYLMRCDLHK